MFTTNLHDLIKGIRKHTPNERAYVSKCLKEIKNELKNVKPNVKAVAVRLFARPRDDKSRRILPH